MHNNSFGRFQEYLDELFKNMTPFPTEGDVPVLQFINTKTSRYTPEAKDRLKNYQFFVRWAFDFKIISEKIYEELSLEGYSNEREAAVIFNKAMGIRDSLYELIISFMVGMPASPQELNLFNNVNNEANRHLCFAMTELGPKEVWINTTEQIAFPLWRIVKRAGELITSAEIFQIKKCPCGNLFLDRSKRNDRNWCKRACGKSYWSKEYYRRKKELIG
jgi:predicted RNA-binding Zn ribbon-like protein